MDWAITAIVTLGVSGFMSLLIIIGLLHNPRMALHSFPQAIQDAVRSKTVHEKRLTAIYSLGTIAALFITPFAYALMVEETSFSVIWLHVFAIAMVFNIVDLLLIDWLLLCMITPSWAIIPGTESGHAYSAYKDYRFHFNGFITGIAFCVALPTIIIGLVWVKNLVI